MAYLCKIFIVFCFLFTFMISCTESNKDAKIAFPIFDVSRFCYDRSAFGRSRKIICLLCKGFDPSCFKYSTSTSTTSTTTTSTTTTSTTTTTQKPTTTKGTSVIPTEMPPKPTSGDEMTTPG